MSDINTVKQMEPVEIALTLFSEDPKEPFSCQLYAYDNEPDALYLFEIVLTIMMEGVDIITDLNTVDIKQFNENHILALNSWFRSVGFDVHITELNEPINNHYCRIILRKDCKPEYVNYFNNTKYHFLINTREYHINKQKKNVDELTALFEVNSKKYKIWFTVAKLG